MKNPKLIYPLLLSYFPIGKRYKINDGFNGSRLSQKFIHLYAYNRFGSALHQLIFQTS